MKYFNNAGAGLMSDKTFNTIVKHMQEERTVGAIKAANDKKAETEDFYSIAAKLLNADKSEIAFIDSASRGWNLITYGMTVNENSTIITLESEYGTNLLTIRDIVDKTKCNLIIIKCDISGHFSMNDIEAALKNSNPILAVSHVAAQGSIINPVEELGELAQKYSALYIVDGCQAVGQFAVDVKKIQCHAYMTAGRKWLRGPRGTGILYVKKDKRLRTPIIDLASADLVFDDNHKAIGLTIRPDARQYELWEKNTANVLGLRSAIYEYLDFGVEKASSIISKKANQIRSAIVQNNKLQLVGDTVSLSGTSAFYLKNPVEEEKVKALFEQCGFTISCVCDWDCPIFFPQNGASYIFRISVHYYTDQDDIIEMCDLINHI